MNKLKSFFLGPEKKRPKPDKNETKKVGGKPGEPKRSEQLKSSHKKNEPKKTELEADGNETNEESDAEIFGNGRISSDLLEEPVRSTIVVTPDQGAVRRSKSPSSQQLRITQLTTNIDEKNGTHESDMEPVSPQHKCIENIQKPDFRRVEARLSMDCIKSENEHFKPIPNYPSNDGNSIACALPEVDWKQSYPNDTSVSFLQGRLVQMEEAQHSTNEELQATLQELADLQSQLTELHADWERMSEEKHVLLESLCRQTEKLEDTRGTVKTLKGLLLEEKGESSDAERECKLVDLLKSAQEERETLLLKQEELNNQLTELRNTATSEEKTTSRLEERINVLESAYKALKAEQEHTEIELAASKEEATAHTIEINRLNTLLDHAKAKIGDLEQTRALTDKSELEEVIDISRREKDNLETQVAHLQEQLSKSICEVNKLTEQVQKLQEELKVSRNNAKSAMSDMEYNMEQMKTECVKLTHEHQENLELIAELQVQVACHIEDKKQLEAVLIEAQKSLAVSEKKLRDMEKIVSENSSAHTAKSLEWEQFQSDLLVTVRVANEMSTEAMSKVEVYAQENTVLKDKLKSMEMQIEKFKAKSPASSILSDASASVLNSVQQDLASRRSKAGVGKQDNRLSVKSLIESIENATKHAKAGPSSTNSSNTSLSTGRGCELFMGDEVDDVIVTNSQCLFSEESSVGGEMQASMGERRMSSGDVGDKDPLLRLAKHGGSKRNALLKWCQTKTEHYHNIDITNFSTSWNDGLAFCALLHTYLPDLIPYDNLASSDARRNFSLAFKAAESVGIPTTLSLDVLVQTEKPDWKQVMSYITAIYKHFES